VSSTKVAAGLRQTRITRMPASQSKTRYNKAMQDLALCGSLAFSGRFGLSRLGKPPLRKAGTKLGRNDATLW